MSTFRRRKRDGIDLITRNHARRNTRALIERRRIVWPDEQARYRRKIREPVVDEKRIDGSLELRDLASEMLLEMLRELETIGTNRRPRPAATGPDPSPAGILIDPHPLRVTPAFRTFLRDRVLPPVFPSVAGSILRIPVARHASTLYRPRRSYRISVAKLRRTCFGVHRRKSDEGLSPGGEKKKKKKRVQRAKGYFSEIRYSRFDDERSQRARTSE